MAADVLTDASMAVKIDIPFKSDTTDTQRQIIANYNYNCKYCICWFIRLFFLAKSLFQNWGSSYALCTIQIYNLLINIKFSIVPTNLFWCHTSRTHDTLQLVYNENNSMAI